MRRVALAIFGTIAGLVGLLSFKTHEPTAATPVAAVSTAVPGPTATSAVPSTSAAAPSAGSSSTTSTPKASASSSSSGSSASSSAASKTVIGDSIDTRWGPVQVKITVSNGKVTAATAVDYPQNNGRDQEINATAIPTLERESIGVSSAKIDAVSGATYTSDGYIQSLQSALTRAGL